MAIQRVSNIQSNQTAQNLDYDVSILWNWLLDNNGGIMFSDILTKTEFVFDKATGILTAGSGIANAVILCTRPTSNPIANQKFLAQFQMFGTVTGLQTTNGTKVYIEIKENLINDPSLIEDQSGSSDFAKGFNIGEVKATASYPTHTNYIKLWEINGSGVLVDMRQGLSVPYVDEQVSLLQDQIDVHEGRIDAIDTEIVSMQNDIVALQIGGEITKSMILGETIATAGIVSLMSDNKIYKYNFGKRNMSNGVITGHTLLKSCLLPDNKIATIGITGNTLTLYIGTIDIGLNTITYGTGVVVTDNAISFAISKAGNDSLFVGYTATGPYTYGRAITVSGTTPTIGTETTLRGLDNGEYYIIEFAVFVNDGVIAFADRYSTSNGTYGKIGVRVVQINGLVLTVGGIAIVLNGLNSEPIVVKDLQYISNDLIAISVWSSVTPFSQIHLISVSGTTPTAGTVYDLLNTTICKIVSDGTYVYVLSNGTTVLKLSKSGTTLSLVWSATVTSGTGICILGGMIGIVVGTNIIRHTISTTSLVVRNTVDYGIDLTNLYENPFGQTYSIITVSGNPAYIYKIGNESRNIVGYLSDSGIAGSGGAVLLKGAIIDGLSNIIPGETYYITRSTLALGLTGDVVFGRGFSPTEIRITYDF